MEKDEKNFIKKIYIDKACNKTNIPILLMFLSLLTYIEPIICGNFDFGIIFEIISIIFLLIAKNYMLKYDEIKANRFIIFSMLAIGWLIVYDIIYIFIYSKFDRYIFFRILFLFWRNTFNFISNSVICY